MNEICTGEITRAEAMNVIRKTRGQFFGISFVKKDDTVRHMTARLGVHSHLRGGADTTAHIPKYVNVWDARVRNYRKVNCNTIFKLRAGSKTYSVC